MRCRLKLKSLPQVFKWICIGLYLIWPGYLWSGPAFSNSSKNNTVGPALEITGSSDAKQNAATDLTKISNGNYVLRPCDVVQVEVFQEADLLKQVRIAADGSVVLPLIGKMYLAGTSISEAQDRIRELYAKSYFVDPHVNLAVVEFAPQGVQVLGQVQSPGYVPITPEETMTLSKAIAGAKGMNLRADYSCVRIKRTDANGKVTVMKVNFNQVIKHPDTEDLVLYNGDMIFVDERIF